MWADNFLFAVMINKNQLHFILPNKCGIASTNRIWVLQYEGLLHVRMYFTHDAKRKTDGFYVFGFF